MLPMPDGAHALHRAIELFNAGRYEEAHEGFEVLWESTQDERSDFYKGLIQASIALYHYERGNLAGAAKLYSGHRRLLGRYSPSFEGVDVGALLADMQRFLVPAVRGLAAADAKFDREARPLIRMSAQPG